MKRMTFRDHDGRAFLSDTGKQIYTSTQATADTLAKYEEMLIGYGYHFEQDVTEASYKNDYECGYAQALIEINLPMKPVVETWEASKCPRCGTSFDEECDDGYYTRATDLMRCPHCGQVLDWEEHY